MSINNNSRGSLNRKNIGMVLERSFGDPNTHRNEDVEIAEEVTPPDSHKIHEEKHEENSFLPKISHTYGGTYINAIARDPFWIFAYWEVSESAKEDVRRRYGFNAWKSSQPVLKVYDTTNLYFFDSRQTSEIQINDLASSWYINVDQPDHSYFVELGRILPDGTYILIVRSNMVTTPRIGISDVVDLEWMVPAEYEKGIYGMPPKANGSPDFLEEMAQKAAVTKIEQEHISSPMNW